jgi:glutamate synthase domain-containing protein 3
VIEGVGDHGCEYMTGGRAVILGPTGLNFAAGMSGGVAYVWDVNKDFAAKCNTGTVDLEAIEEDEDIVELREMIELHKEYTGSTVAAQILDEWPMSIRQFVKVMPTDYKRVLTERKRHDEEVEQTLRDETGTFAIQAGR